jgi:TolB protein
VFRATIAVLVALSIAFPVQLPAADVYLGLQRGGDGKALGVGIAQFAGRGADAQAKTLRSVLRNDLLFSRLFSVVEGGPQPDPSGKLDALAWSGVGAQVVVDGDVRVAGDNVTLECRIYDVASGKRLWGKEATGTASAIRRIAHLMADEVTFQLSGQPGIARTRIAFVNNRTRNKEVYVIDYDGADLRQMTFHHSIALLPKWSPDGKSIAFNSYRAQNPDAYLLDYPSGTLRELSTRQGLNTAPNWSPDGATLAVTISKSGNPEIFLIKRTGQVIRQLTFSPGVDTSPSYSPNGQQIAFISDRAGNPELYVMDISGANVQRLTYGQVVDAPAWSPRGDLIAYQRQRSRGQFDIYLIEPNGKNNRQLTGNEGRVGTHRWGSPRFLKGRPSLAP